LALSPGTRLGPYEVTAQIGVGGMGEVYRATDTNLKRQVAIKVLPATVAGDAERLVRFQREAEVLAQLNHPNIAHIHGLERADGHIALVMELIEGPTLADRIAQGAIPIDEALAIARQIAEALEAAHEQGIIHRDLKPANVKVRPDGAVKVLDFGLAKALEPAAGVAPSLSMSPTITTPALTRAGMILGTAAYMAPEQARGTPLDKRADVWAFGCVLYEMLTGKRAFGGDEVADVLARVIAGDPDFSQLPSSTPAVLRLLRRCLVKDRRWRLPDLAMARIEIEDARMNSPETLAPSSQNAGRRYAPFVWLGGAAVLAAVAALAAFTIAPRAPEPLLTRLEVTTPPTFDSSSFALSPDGRQLVFVANAEGRPQLWIRPLDDETARPISGTSGASAPFWSPDSRDIGFFAEGKLKTINVMSGAARVLADAASGRGGTWNRDGVIVFAPETNYVGMMRVAATGGTPTAVTKLGAGLGLIRFSGQVS
jgi:serine/threonine protein kinase